ncbi:MAG: hypothetical protein KAI94_15765 [Anaerolineales bacterium]|nr:hypothetical protein [Anaerolineales bacterium]
MASAIVKLFRMPEEAQKAMSDLKNQGYTAEDISGAPEKELADTWGLDEETVKYYQFGVALGGILIGVKADEAKSADVRKIMRSAESSPEREKVTSSPAFKQASRMSASNPIDAPMSGDFRKY